MRSIPALFSVTMAARATNTRRGAGRRRIAVTAAPVLVGAMAAVVPLAPAQADVGDFSLNLVAAAPYSYDHHAGGGAFDDATKGKSADVVESLEASDFTCGDIVTYLTQVSVDDTTGAGTDGPQTIEVDYQFLMDTTGQSGAAIGDITRVNVNYSPVVDTITGEDTVDQGIVDDGGSVATLVSETQSGPIFQAGSVLEGTVRVTDLERAEKVVVRVDVRLFCQPGSSPTGNLQGAVSGARLTFIQDNVPVSPAANISVGNQTVPFLQFGNLRFPALAIAKTVTTAGGTCPGTENINIQSGDTVKYCYLVTNPSTAAAGAPLYDLTSVTDDNRTPSVPSDDFTVALTGLTDADGDGESDDLAAGSQASGEKLVNIVASTPGTYTNTATVKGYTFPGDTSEPLTATDTASVTVTSVPVPAINLSKTPGTVTGPDANSKYQVTYQVTVANSGTTAGTYGPITDTPQFSPNLGIDAISWTGPASTQGSTNVIGTAGTAIAAGATHTYDVTVTFHYTDTAAATACNGTAGNGLYNSATLPSGQEQGPLTDNNACVEPPGGPWAGLSIKKVVNLSQAAPGDTVTYTLTVKNTGPGAAENVVVTDNLPAGTEFVSATSPCTNGPTVSCSLGTLAAGSTTILTLKVKVALVSGGTSHQHQLDYTKVESHLSLFDGDTVSATATCPTGYFATDGSVRLDHVDQDTGTFADAAVLASGVTPDGKSWTGRVRNDATGQVQAKVNVVCMTLRTTSGENHSHDVVVTGPQSSTRTLAAGRNDVDLTCGAGYYAIAPSFVFSAGEGVVSTRRLPDGGWRFTVDTTASATGTFSITCLSTTLATAHGHNHELRFTEITDTVTVPAHEVKEVRLTCPVGYKGIVAWADMDPGLLSLGNDPQPITRVFRFYNPTGGPLTADYGLLCVGIRTTGSGDSGGDITNSASVSTTSQDISAADNQSSATFTVRAVDALGVTVTSQASVLTRAGRTLVALEVKAAGKRTVTFKLFAGGRVRGTQLKAGSLLAKRAVTLSRGGATVRLVATRAARNALRQGKIDRAKLVIIRNGAKEVRWVRIRG